MSAEEYDKLIEIGLREEPKIQVSSRIELEKLRESMILEMDEAASKHQFRHAQAIQDSLEEVELLFEDYPVLKTLESQRSAIEHEQNAAMGSKDFVKAEKLKEEKAFSTRKSSWRRMLVWSAEWLTTNLPRAASAALLLYRHWPLPCLFGCGDGMVFSQIDECDDGNDFNGDGCDQWCRLEQ